MEMVVGVAGNECLPSHVLGDDEILSSLLALGAVKELVGHWSV